MQVNSESVLLLLNMDSMVFSKVAIRVEAQPTYRELVGYDQYVSRCDGLNIFWPMQRLLHVCACMHDNRK